MDILYGLTLPSIGRTLEKLSYSFPNETELKNEVFKKWVLVLVYHSQIE